MHSSLFFHNYAREQDKEAGRRRKKHLIGRIACFLLFILFSFCISFYTRGSGFAQSAMREGWGLSANYPGDVGIAADEKVIFAEDFEKGNFPELSERWSSVSNQGGKVLALVADGPPAAEGRQCIQMTATLGENTGGSLHRRLIQEVQRAFFRFYVKFDPNASYIHHLVHVGGYCPSTPYPQGHAGERPNGDDRFTVGIEPSGNYGWFPAPGAWRFYAYWQEMKKSSDGKYWGQSLLPIKPAIAPRDRWQCVEVMLKLNSRPELADGELALWLDGKLIAHFAPGVRRSRWTGMGFSIVPKGGEVFEGFRWRNSDDLKINFFWLLHYVTENASRQNRVKHPNPINRVWFDNIVVATEYVGPAKPRE